MPQVGQDVWSDAARVSGRCPSGGKTVAVEAGDQPAGQVASTAHGNTSFLDKKTGTGAHPSLPCKRVIQSLR